MTVDPNEQLADISPQSGPQPNQIKKPKGGMERSTSN